MIGADRWISQASDEAQSKHAEQRYSRGYSDQDMWNFDTFLMDVIVAGCTWQLKNRSGYPEGKTDTEWAAILEEIRVGFKMSKPSKRAWKLLRDNFAYMWD